MIPRRLLAALSLLLLAACGGGGSDKAAATPTPAVAAGPVAATPEEFAAIAASWEAFFNPSGTVAEHVALLENGDKFTAELTAASQDPSAKDLSAKLLTATVDGDNADVTYDLLGTGGAKLLAGANGKAVKADGSWKVSTLTYCQLVSLQDPNGQHPGCG